MNTIQTAPRPLPVLLLEKHTPGHHKVISGHNDKHVFTAMRGNDTMYQICKKVCSRIGLIRHALALKITRDNVAYHEVIAKLTETGRIAIMSLSIAIFGVCKHAF